MAERSRGHQVFRKNGGASVDFKAARKRDLASAILDKIQAGNGAPRSPIEEVFNQNAPSVVVRINGKVVLP